MAGPGRPPALRAAEPAAVRRGGRRLRRQRRRRAPRVGRRQRGVRDALCAGARRDAARGGRAPARSAARAVARRPRRRGAGGGGRGAAVLRGAQGFRLRYLARSGRAARAGVGGDPLRAPQRVRARPAERRPRAHHVFVVRRLLRGGGDAAGSRGGMARAAAGTCARACDRRRAGAHGALRRAADELALPLRLAVQARRDRPDVCDRGPRRRGGSRRRC